MTTRDEQESEVHRANTADNCQHATMGAIFLKRIVEPTLYLVDDNDTGVWTGEIRSMLRTIGNVAATIEAFTEAVAANHAPDVPF